MRPLSWWLVAYLTAVLLQPSLSAPADQTSAETSKSAGRESKIPGKVVAAWYAGWHATGTKPFPLSKVPWSKYTHLIYAFAETTPDVRKLSFEGSNPSVFPEFVKQAHKNDVKALVAIGGWTGSRYFSTNVGSAQNRTAFVKTIVNLVKKYNLDGVDFDWEYPAKQGIGCNTINSKDTSNFLSFLQELRRDPTGASILITAATATVPFTAPDGTPSSNVSAFAKVLDYVAIMNYDMWGPWSATVGPNSPLDDACAPEQSRVSSAISAVKAWTSAGFPAKQLVLGVPGYGHAFRVRRADAYANGSTTTLAAFPRFDAVDRPVGDAWDDQAGEVDVCGEQQLAGGIYTLWGLIDTGFLKKDGSPAPGINYRYDTCSQTPYVYNPASEIMVSYDNPQSFAAKGAYIKSAGLKGFAVWEAGGDHKNWLLTSIREAAAF